MEIDNESRTIVFRARRPVRHGASLLICLPHVAREWLRIDETSRLDITLDIDNESLHIRKGEKNGGIDTAVRRGGATAPQGDTTDQIVPTRTTQEPVIPYEPLDLTAIEKQLFQRTTTVEGQEPLDNPEVYDGQAAKDGASYDTQEPYWQDSDPQDRDGLD